MLQVSCPVHYFLIFILKVYFNIIADIIKQGFRLSQALTQKSLEFLLGDRNVDFIFYFFLILPSLEQSYLFNKNRSKQYFVLVLSFSGGKIIFVLLEKIIAL